MEHKYCLTTASNYKAKVKYLGSQDFVAEKLGLARRTMARRCNGGSEINKEMEIALDYLIVKEKGWSGYQI